uniref:Ribosomal protein S8 n=1 Tax=Piridium sociabile TaxID=2570542 RepID=A0A5B9XW97_9ALVE|nr:ribosomal protein S8 [Piridium sociabile]
MIITQFLCNLKNAYSANHKLLLFPNINIIYNLCNVLYKFNYIKEVFIKHDYNRKREYIIVLLNRENPISGFKVFNKKKRLKYSLKTLNIYNKKSSLFILTSVNGLIGSIGIDTNINRTGLIICYIW